MGNLNKRGMGNGIEDMIEDLNNQKEQLHTLSGAINKELDSLKLHPSHKAITNLSELLRGRMILRNRNIVSILGVCLERDSLFLINKNPTLKILIVKFLKDFLKCYGTQIPRELEVSINIEISNYEEFLITESDIQMTNNGRNGQQPYSKQRDVDVPNTNQSLLAKRDSDRGEKSVVADASKKLLTVHNGKGIPRYFYYDPMTGEEFLISSSEYFQLGELIESGRPIDQLIEDIRSRHQEQ